MRPSAAILALLTGISLVSVPRQAGAAVDPLRQFVAKLILDERETARSMVDGAVSKQVFLGPPQPQFDQRLYNKNSSISSIEAFDVLARCNFWKLENKNYRSSPGFSVARIDYYCPNGNFFITFQAQETENLTKVTMSNFHLGIFVYDPSATKK